VTYLGKNVGEGESKEGRGILLGEGLGGQGLKTRSTTKGNHVGDKKKKGDF